MRFAQYLNEEYAASNEYGEIFVNPSSSELRQAGKVSGDIRFILDARGNKIFVSNANSMIHPWMLQSLIDAEMIKGIPKEAHWGSYRGDKNLLMGKGNILNNKIHIEETSWDFAWPTEDPKYALQHFKKFAGRFTNFQEFFK